MLRILVFGMTENYGGIESYLINYYRNINPQKIQFDFLCNTHKQIAYENELIKLGGRVLHITARSDNYKRYKNELEKVFKNHALEWDAIYVNVCSLANIDYLKIAKKYGIKRRIIHSHNSQNMDSWFRELLHYWNKKQIEKYATDFWACSSDAAKYFYKKETIEKAIIIHNAIEVDRFKFDEEKRIFLRNKYGFENKFVIGNVGRLHFQKNQEFILNIFSQYHKKNSNSILVLVGQGEDEKRLKKKAKELGLQNVVYFVGIQTDIQMWLSSFDCFLFPSKFEGFGMAALEAEANGIFVLASKEVIPKEIKMNKNFIFLNLKDDIEIWSKKIEEMETTPREAFNVIKDNFFKNGYDIQTEIKKIENLLGIK